MNFKITIVILLIVKCVELGSCADEVTDLKHNVVNLEKDCGPGSKPCVVKCCGENEVIRKKKKKFACRDINSVMKEVNGSSTLLYQLTNYPELKISLSGNVSKAFKKDFNLLQSKKFAENMNSLAVLTPFDEPLVTFMENGDLKIFSSSTRRAPRFCVDMVVITRNGIPDNETYNYFVEVDDRSVEREKSQFNIYGYIVSSVFILLVLLVYVLLQDLHSCVHGLLLMAFIATLMIYYSSQAFFVKYQIDLSLSGMSPTESYFDVCKWIKPLNYFLLLSTLTWLNTMCFDIWWRFRGMKRVVRTKGITRAIRMKFLRCSLYAWGLPIAMTVTAILIDYLADDDYVKPALKSCIHNINNRARQNMYKYIPIAILLFTNVVFYLMTVYNTVWLPNCTSSTLKKAGSNKSKKNYNQFIIITKLFVIMGLGWIIDLVQIILEEDLDPWLFYFLNAYSAYIGVIIFFVLVCKQDIFIELCKRLGIENRWTRRNAHKSSSRTDTTKDSKNLSKGRAMDDSIYIESTQFSDADTKRDSQRNPMLTVSETQAEL